MATDGVIIKNNDDKIQEVKNITLFLVHVVNHQAFTPKRPSLMIQNPGSVELCNEANEEWE